MEKFNFNGKQYVKLDSLKHEIRRIRKSIQYFSPDLAECEKKAALDTMNLLVRAIYREEISATYDPDIIDSILEMSGSFVVYRSVPGNKNKFEYFHRFSNGRAVFSEDEGCMIFSYESKAREIADSLGEEWDIADVSEEAYKDSKALLNIIFDRESTSSSNNVVDLFDAVSKNKKV